MEKINFNYSLKNIPVPSKSSYKLKLIDKIESVIKRMRWKAHFFINGDSTETKKETYGFKSKQYPSQIKELDMFEKDLFELVKSVKFRNSNDEFQNEIKDDINKIKSSSNVFIPADKTTNMYELTPKEYKKLLRNNVTKTYRKAPPRLEKAINLEAKEIAKNINLDDRIECIAKNNAFVTLKDHKQNFRSAIPCRLINPCKSELGKIIKIMLENINKTLIEQLNVNQRKNTESVIHWFKSIQQKPRCFFIQFDVIEFYPSITEKFLEEVIVSAKQRTEIEEKDLRIIKHCRKSLLYHEDEAWKKKESKSCFDVTMGCNDGAEICELTGICILSQLSNLLPREDTGLYGDDNWFLLLSFTNVFALFVTLSNLLGSVDNLNVIYQSSI